MYKTFFIRSFLCFSLLLYLLSIFSCKKDETPDTPIPPEDTTDVIVNELVWSKTTFLSNLNVIKDLYKLPNGEYLALGLLSTNDFSLTNISSTGDTLQTKFVPKMRII